MFVASVEQLSEMLLSIYFLLFAIFWSRDVNRKCLFYVEPDFPSFLYQCLEAKSTLTMGVTFVLQFWTSSMNFLDLVLGFKFVYTKLLSIEVL